MTARPRATSAPSRAATDTRGVPSAVPEDRSSSRPLSMLDVVTHHVRPIATPVIESNREDSAPVAAGREAAREVMPAVPSGPVVLAEATPKRSGWMVWAALGILAGGAVVFGIPQIRERVLGAPATPTVVAETSAPKTDGDAKLLDDAAAAIASGDPQTLARAEAALAAAIGTRDAADTAALRVKAAEVLANRAVVHELWGAVEPAMRSDARFWAQEDAARAFALLGALDGKDPSVASAFARATALLRVVQGKGDATGLAIDEETSLVVTVAPLLRDPNAKLSDAVRARLAELSTPSVLARCVLALGHARVGDAAAAKKVIAGVLAEAPGQPVARALARATETPSGTPKPDGGEDPVVVADTGNGGTTPPADPATPTESVGSLIDRGCRKAEAGDGAAAVALLKKALEKRPNDTDALLCMGDANSRLGAYDVALKHYERALGRAPQMLSALQGAGKAAAKLGRTSKAMKFYQRLLEHDPSHSQARAYVDEHKNDAPAATAGDETDNG
jgi:tetratricopeptide (TPR) repeat protein